MLVTGIIGAGSISDFHINPYLENQNCRIKAIADINIELATEKAKKYNIEKVYADYKEILQDEEIDAVSIVTPTFTHKNIVLEAIKSGKHILCEKPPALNAEETRECMNLAKNSDKVLMYAFVCRFKSQIQYMKNYIESGKMGKIISAETVRTNLCEKTGGWFLDKKLSGGGPLRDIAIHELDSMLYMMGYPKAKVVLGFASDINKDLPGKIKGYDKGWVSVDVKSYDRNVENVASGYITFENGSYLFIKTSTILNVVKEERYLNICGEKAGVKMEPDISGSELKLIEITEDHYFNDVVPKIANVNPYKGEVDHFVDCCTKGTECICKPEEAVRLMEIIDAIYQSAETGEPIVF